MNWITDFVRPKFQALVTRKKETAEDLWDQCPQCEQMIYHKELTRNLHVCHHCQHHMRLSVHKRLQLLFDQGHYDCLPIPSVPLDPLKFKDTKKYVERYKASKAQTGEEDALVLAQGKISGHSVVMAVFNFAFMGGSMGMKVGEGLLEGAQKALAQRVPYIVIPASGGARMQEGILSLMQMPRATVGVHRLKKACLPYIVILTDPTTGGVAASFAMLGDITLAEPNALIGFTGARVIKETIRGELPPGFQRTEYLYEHGMIDGVVHRHHLKETVGNILNMLLIKKAVPNKSSL